MFNVKRKPNSTPVAEPEEAQAEERKENETPFSVPEVQIESIATPPLTPHSDNGDVSTDEQSVDSVEEPTVEEACKEDTGEDDSSKNEAFDVEVCEEEMSKDEDYDIEACEDGSKEDDYDLEACEDLSKDEAAKDQDSKSEESKDEKSKDEETKDEESKNAEATDEAGSSSAPSDEVETSSAPEEDPEEVHEAQVPTFLPNRNGYKIYVIWLVFWVVALGGGFISYYFNGHQDIVAARLGGLIVRDENLLLMPREKWDDSRDLLAKPTSYTAQRVVVVQTDTEGCETITTCTKLLNALKRKEGNLKYNFLLATDGCIYEWLGWQEPSPMFPGTRTMVVAFIGNYETVAPSAMQLSQFQALLEASEELRYLNGAFNIIGRKQTGQPNKLFAYMAAFEKWDKANSDTDEQYIEVEFEQFPIFDV